MNRIEGRPMVIGISGYKGSGKDTLAEYLVDEINRINGFPHTPAKAGRYWMAGPGRAIGREFGFTDEEMMDPVLKEQPSKVLGIPWRKFAQWLMTDVCRDQINERFPYANIGQDLWVMLCKHNLSMYNMNYGELIYIISDIRFDNECEMIKEYYNGVIINVVRGTVKHADNHVSEKGISPEYIDHHVLNDGTLDDLKQQAVELVENLNILRLNT